MEILLIIASVIAGYAYLIKIVIPFYYKLSEGHSYTARVMGRSFIAALIYGVGIIGTEGFGLPGPVLLALLFTSMQPWEYFLNLGLIPFLLCWLISIGIFLFRERVTLNKKRQSDA